MVIAQAATMTPATSQPIVKPSKNGAVGSQLGNVGGDTVNEYRSVATPLLAIV